MTTMTTMTKWGVLKSIDPNPFPFHSFISLIFPPLSDLSLLPAFVRVLLSLVLSEDHRPFAFFVLGEEFWSRGRVRRVEERRRLRRREKKKRREESSDPPHPPHHPTTNSGTPPLVHHATLLPPTRLCSSSSSSPRRRPLARPRRSIDRSRTASDEEAKNET